MLTHHNAEPTYTVPSPTSRAARTHSAHTRDTRHGKPTVSRSGVYHAPYNDKAERTQTKAVGPDPKIRRGKEVLAVWIPSRSTFNRGNSTQSTKTSWGLSGLYELLNHGPPAFADSTMVEPPRALERKE
ncbi:hypothetical protein T265_05053 [Opisthorchis viverrini]|uniref:Uncharacterized protein n=1 Tax=Opisthorchis viverrini TaxID=6198 RepID=A0A074ZXC7_OPIVI|nr:hypothetical protein T265_05053 [Opisthorchis viverrini]KER28005.1 hypothetical protein T265_05053 [Opisthorchis viverrini]